MKEITVEAAPASLGQVQDFVAGCAAHTPLAPQLHRIALAVEEVFVNIAHYAYAADTGQVTVRCTVGAEAITLEFEDRGRPFDPLATRDPDITLPAAERQIGGLGIFLVKKVMDNVNYRYEDGRNILTLSKRWRGVAG